MIAALLASPAAARCIGSTDPLVHKMEMAIGRDPVAALDLIDRQIADADPANRSRLAELQLAKSQALSMSGADSRPALDKARRVGGAFGPKTNIGLYLRISDAVRDADLADAAKALQAIAPDVAALPNGSRAKTCRSVDMAYYNSMAERSREAMTFAIAGYRNAQDHEESLERAKATSMFANLVSMGHDFDYASELYSEAYTIEQKLDLSDLAANEVLLRGYTQLDRGDWRRALKDFEASAREARGYGNQYAVDFALLGVCEAALEGELVARAAPACERAYESLNVPGEEMDFLATTLMARLLVKQGEPTRALGMLDPLIADGEGFELTNLLIMARETRAEALSQLGRNAEAYAAMKQARREAERLYDSELRSGVSALQARFQTEDLQRRLSVEERASYTRLRLAVAVIAGSVTTLLLLGTLIFALLRHRRRFRRLANTDPLTGLANRRATLERADEALRAQGTERPRASIALFDIDHFKSCNDTYGHDAGDMILSEFARILEGCVRPSDIVGRWGGEEFLAIFPGTSAQEAARIIERVRLKAARETFDFAPDYSLKFSAGVAMLDETDDGTDACIKLADKRLYAAKAQGRDRTCTSGHADDIATISAKLRKAVSSPAPPASTKVA